MLDDQANRFPIEGLSEKRREAALRDGIVRTDLKKMDPEQKSARGYRLRCSSLRQGPDNLELPLLEMRAWAGARTGMPYNEDPMERENQDKLGHPRYLSDPELRADLAQAVLSGLCDGELITRKDRMLEVGGGHGDFARAAGAAGFNITVLELKALEERKDSKPTMIYESIQHHAIQREGCYDTVIALNFYADPETESDYFKGVSRAMKPDTGRFIIGPAASNADFLSAITGTGLRPRLEKFFEVEFKSAKNYFPKQFDELGSVGGMIGFFVYQRKGKAKPKGAEAAGSSGA